MALQSEYYSDFETTMDTYDIAEEAYPFAAEGLQSVEDLFFSFTIFLIT